MGNNTVTKISASEVQRTKTEIHALLNQYPELGTNQGYVAALSELPKTAAPHARYHVPKLTQ